MRILLVLLLSFALSPIMALGNTVPVPGEGASITIPDDWVILDRPNLALVAAAPSETTALGISVKANADHLPVDDPHYLSAMEDNVLEKAAKSGASLKIIDPGPRKLHGVPAAFMETEQVFPGNQIVYGLTYDVAANGKLYYLTLDTRDSFQVATLKKIAESLQFDRPPVIPAELEDTNFLEHRFMEIAAVVLALGLAVWIIRWLIRRSTAY